MPLPTVGELVEVKFPRKTLKGFVTGSFETPVNPDPNRPAEKDSKDCYIGVSVEMAELPQNAENTGWGVRLLDLLEARGPKGFLEFVRNPESTIVYVYGSELTPTDGVAPEWFEKFKLSSQEELAALAPAILGPKNWKDQLYYDAWDQGKWDVTAYSPLSAELQKIRNTANSNYIDWVEKKHQEFIRAAKKSLQSFKIYRPKVCTHTNH